MQLRIIAISSCVRICGLLKEDVLKKTINEALYEKLEDDMEIAIALINQLSSAQATLKRNVKSLTKGTNSYVAVRRSIRVNRQLLRWANKAISRYHKYRTEHGLFYF